MRIFLNDFELNNPAKRVYINEDVEGLDLPSIRTSSGQRSGQSGGYFGAQLWDSRRITIQGGIFSSSVSEALERRREIQAALPLYPESVTVRILDDDGYAYILYCQVMDFKMPIKRARMKSLFKLELEAADPTIYDDTAGAALEATINQLVPGGVSFSDVSPQFGSTFYFSASSPNSVVTNDSSVTVFPTLVIAGKTTNPTFINRTTGQVFSLDNYGVASDAATQIDMKNHTVRLGSTSELVGGLLPEGVGGNAFSYVSLTDDDWWGLVTGDNEIEFISGAGGDATSAAITWRPGVMGI